VLEGRSFLFLFFKISIRLFFLIEQIFFFDHFYNNALLFFVLCGGAPKT